jgi:hypothetical protein
MHMHLDDCQILLVLDAILQTSNAMDAYVLCQKDMGCKLGIVLLKKQDALEFHLFSQSNKLWK